ncbi:MAG: B12-binding domain-containing radical SAM protein [Mariniphaga sp.]|nr:B12-binding domain-containing radical SAM protein [Mariniphaga sp.]
MKVLLLNPYFGNRVYAPTLGLGFLATYLKARIDCQIEVIEPVRKELNESELLQKIKETDYLGLTCYTESRFSCFNFAEKAKKINPNCCIMVGGSHATALDKKILEHYSFIDVVVRGEGELAILEILKKESLANINGISWRNGSDVIQNPEQCLKKDLSQFDLDYSFIYPEIENWKDREIPYNLQKLKHLPIIASRGCPFRCAFCGSNKHWSGLWRGTSPKDLVKNIKFLTEKYKVGYFRFYDALFIGSDNQILEFCDEIEKSGLKIKFRIDIRVGTKREILERLRHVGCEVVGFGIESGSDKILKRINKGITRKQIEETINICKSLNYWIIGYFMISLPDETQEDFQKSIELFSVFDVFNLQFFKIHPNTTFYEEFKNNDEIDDEIWFDPSRGNEIFYSKEIFPSANFYRLNVDRSIKYFYLKHDLRNPKTVIQKYGLFIGFLRLISSLMQIGLLKNNFSATLLEKIRRSWIGKILKSRFFVK